MMWEILTGTMFQYYGDAAKHGAFIRSGLKGKVLDSELKAWQHFFEVALERNPCRRVSPQYLLTLLVKLFPEVDQLVIKKATGAIKAVVRHKDHVLFTQIKMAPECALLASIWSPHGLMNH
jgi:hypothetical protein